MDRNQFSWRQPGRFLPERIFRCRIYPDIPDGRHTAFLNGGPNPEQAALNEIRRLVNRAIMAKNGEWLGLENSGTIEGAIDRERAIGAAGALEAVLGALNGRPERLAGMSS